MQEREKTLSEAFQETVADNLFEDFLTKVFKKAVKRDKKKEQDGGGGGRKRRGGGHCVPASVISQTCVCRGRRWGQR